MRGWVSPVRLIRDLSLPLPFASVLLLSPHRVPALHPHIYPSPHAADNPSVLTRPPGGLGRGRVCSIDRRRSAKLAERDRAPSWRRTSRISPFACRPPFRKSSYPLLDLPPRVPPSTLRPRRARHSPYSNAAARSCLASFSAATIRKEEEKG